MVLFEGTLGLGIGLLLAVALAEIAKYRERHEKAFRALAASAVMFLVASVFTLSPIVTPSNIYTIAKQVFEALGKIFAVIAAGLLLYESLMKRIRKEEKWV